MSMNRIFVVVALCMTAVAGCDDAMRGDGDAVSSVHIDLEGLRNRAQEVQEIDCLSVLDEAVLMADGREVGREVFPPRVFSVTFDEVRVDVGRVQFDVDVASNIGSPLYTGSASEDIEDDGFVVNVPLRAEDAVLVVCPASLELTTSRDYIDTLFVFNLGRDTLSAQLWSPIGFRDAPYLNFQPSTLLLQPGTVQGVRVSSTFGSVGPRTMAIFSRIGNLEIEAWTPDPVELRSGAHSSTN